MRSSIFFQLTKVDEVKRIVSGVATAEVADKANEILDYETSVPYFKKWSAEIEKASNGKSLGNVREMHDNKAVGKLVELNFDDATKSISVSAKIVEESTWQKVLEGVLTGFSIGGDYVKKWKDAANTALTRFTADPSEISVVDNPCVGIATFEYIKADGSKEMRKLKSITIDLNDKKARKAIREKVVQKWSATDGKLFDLMDDCVKHQAEIDAALVSGNISVVQKAAVALAEVNAQIDALDPSYWETEEYEAALLKDCAETDDVKKREFSDAKRKEMAGAGEAMSDGSYPIASPKDVENAVHDWGRTGSKDSVKEHIKRRAKAIGAEESLPADWKGSEKLTAFGALEKVHAAPAYDASAVMEAIHRVIIVLAREEAEVKRGDSEDAAQVAMLEAALDKLKEFVASEIKETPSAEEEEAAKLHAAGLKKLLEKSEIPADKHASITEWFDGVMKAGRRHSAADAGKLAAMHEHVDDMGDHLDKMRKMHKAMSESVEAMGDSTHAEHVTKMKGHLNRMDKCMSKAEATHGEMSECMKGLGMEGEKFESGALAKFTAANDKLEADNAALSKSLAETTEGLNGLAKRLKLLEEQPNPNVKRPAIFHVEKANETRIEEPGAVSDDLPQANPFGSGLAPGVARFRKQV